MVSVRGVLMQYVKFGKLQPSEENTGPQMDKLQAANEEFKYPKPKPSRRNRKRR
jgi:hypothetical protein